MNDPLKIVNILPDLPVKPPIWIPFLLLLQAEECEEDLADEQPNFDTDFRFVENKWK